MNKCHILEDRSCLAEYIQDRREMNKCHDLGDRSCIDEQV